MIHAFGNAGPCDANVAWHIASFLRQVRREERTERGREKSWGKDRCSRWKMICVRISDSDVVSRC